jgi:hypothetical protein
MVISGLRVCSRTLPARKTRKQLSGLIPFCLVWPDSQPQMPNYLRGRHRDHAFHMSCRSCAKISRQYGCYGKKKYGKLMQLLKELFEQYRSQELHFTSFAKHVIWTATSSCSFIDTIWVGSRFLGLPKCTFRRHSALTLKSRSLVNRRQTQVVHRMTRTFPWSRPYLGWDFRKTATQYN